MKQAKPRRVSRSRRVEIGFLEGLRRRCPQDTRVLKALGDLYTRAGRVGEGLEVDLLLTRLCSEESEVWYNLGCSLALAHRKDEALEALARAVSLGYRDFNWMRNDRDLDALRDDPRFDRLLGVRGQAG